MKILKSKLQAPGLHNILSRKRLINLFQNIGHRQLATVVAGTGYGKTTLVADAMSQINADAIWYRLDQHDSDFMVFIHYLYHGIIKNNCEDALGLLPKTGVLKNRTQILLEFISTLEKNINRKTFLILDDYHLVHDTPEINEAIEFILERLPENIKLVLISRKDPPVKISRIRALEKLVEITEKDLAFTTSEINNFYSIVKKLPVGDAQINEILEKTGGWAASLVLLSYMLRGKTSEDIKKSLIDFKGTQKFIFSYLEENIFQTQTSEIQNFMLKISLLSEISAKKCNQIFQIDNARSILQQMAADHLLIFPCEDNPDIFYLHHLFQDFLIAKLNHQYQAQEIKSLHLQIAAGIEPDDIFQALHHYILGHDFQAAARLLESNEMKFLTEGKIRFLENCINNIPAAFIEKNPQFLFIQAKVHSYFGSPQKAIEQLKTAHKLFKKMHSQEYMIKCLVDLGSQYYCTGHVKEAMLLMQQVLDEVDETSLTYITAMTYLILLTAVLGEFDMADRYTKEAKAVVQTYPDFERQLATTMIDLSRSYQMYIMGDFNQSQVINKKLLRLSLDLKLEPVLPLVYFQYSATSSFLGQFEQGYRFAEKGLKICEKIDLADSKKAWVYIASAQNCIGLKNFNQAIEHINQAVEIFEEPGNRWGLANAWDCLGCIYLLQGKPDQAKRIIEQAINTIDTYGLGLTKGILYNSIAKAYLQQKKFKTALEYLDKSRPLITGAGFYLAENHLLTAQCCHELTMLKKSAVHLIKGFEISREKDLHKIADRDDQWIGLLLKNKDLDEQHRTRILELLGPGQDITIPVLAIRLLGKLQVFIGNNEVPPSQWKNSKALMILKYLATHRDDGFIPREVLIELLWPDQDIRKTAKRFNMAMSALRKTIEPEILPRASSSYIQRKKDSYRLYPDSRIKIDTEIFLDKIKKAEKFINSDKQEALQQYKKAESFYKGDFLEEDPFEQWCITLREHLNSIYIKMLESLSALYEKEKDINNSILYAQKVLETDPYNEDITRKLIKYHIDSGNIPIARETYKNYQNRIREIDCPENPEIKKILKNLISGQNNS